MTNLTRASGEQVGQNTNSYYWMKYMYFIHIVVKVNIAANLSNGPSIHIRLCNMKVEDAAI